MRYNVSGNNATAINDKFNAVERSGVVAIVKRSLHKQDLNAI